MTKQIQQYINDSKSEDLTSIHSMNKHAMQSVLSAMIVKLLDNKSEEAQEQLLVLQRFDRFLEQLTYRNCVFIFQAKMLTAYERELAILEQDKEELTKENLKLKRNILGNE